VSGDAAARLLAANPVQGDVPAPPIEPLLKRLKEEGALQSSDSVARSSGAARARVLSWSLIALGAVPVAVVLVLVTGALGSHKAARGGSAAAGVGACSPAPIHRGAPPMWASAGFVGGFKVPYALASGASAVSFFFADPVRAGRPTNPYNKVLWVLRSTGTPLIITARWGPDPTVSRRIRLPENASPPGDYPSYVNLPRAGCWTLDLAWGQHRARIDIEVRGRRP
jgi:hypothetical protein